MIPLAECSSLWAYELRHQQGQALWIAGAVFTQSVYGTADRPWFADSLDLSHYPYAVAPQRQCAREVERRLRGFICLEGGIWDAQQGGDVLEDPLL
jgi:hypothetical protein